MIHGAGDTYIKPDMAADSLSLCQRSEGVVDGRRRQAQSSPAPWPAKSIRRRVLEFFDHHLAQDKNDVLPIRRERIQKKVEAVSAKSERRSPALRAVSRDARAERGCSCARCVAANRLRDRHVPSDPARRRFRVAIPAPSGRRQTDRRADPPASGRCSRPPRIGRAKSRTPCSAASSPTRKTPPSAAITISTPSALSTTTAVKSPSPAMIALSRIWPACAAARPTPC